MTKRASRKGQSRGGSGGAHAIGTWTVLHVDDDPNDTELLRAAARTAKVPFAIVNLHDGEEAVAYLGGAGIYANRQRYPVPNLILLDLKLPRAHGLDILKWIRTNAQFNGIPVLIFSGSELKEDMRLAMDHGATSYMVKPLGFENLVKFVQDIKTAWLAPEQT